MRRAVAILLAGCAVSLALVGSAGATGSCGNDFSGNAACGVQSPGSYPGVINAQNESDYYVLYAHANTDLRLTITDTEDPGCGGYACGDARVLIYDNQGNEINSSENSQPQNGITVPRSLDWVIGTTGTYYLVVTGDLGTNSAENSTSVPYTLAVNASPGVHWPPIRTQVCAVKHRWVTRRVRRHHRWVKVRVRVAYKSCHITYV